jgi:xanthine dehydrogenase small subunit
MQAIRREIRFLLNDREQCIAEVSATDTVLDFLRIGRRLTGTKEGCAEGDCGACTVLIGRIANGELIYETVNACIRFMASLDGCHIVTIEHLRGPEGRLHPVQQAMVDFHGSQCGFCTPGIVMSLYALWMQSPSPSRTEIETALQGNLCRCTGYEPIIKAAHAVSQYGTPTSDYLLAERDATMARLAAYKDGARVELSEGSDLAIVPADVDDLAVVLQEHPQATIVAGSTDVGLWVTKMMRPISPAVFIGHLDGLKQISSDGDNITLGAGATYSEAETVLTSNFPHLAEFWNRIAGWQVRNMGTIGGNIANGSPIGDTPPLLIALGAEITLRKGATRRVVPIAEFFIAYGKQDREEGDFVESIHIPKAAANTLHAAYKITKRRDEDISSVCAAFNLTVENGMILRANIAFGGMAATPKRAAHAEAVLIGQPWSEATLIAASRELGKDFTPLSDWRASADYRLRVSQNLFRRFWLEKGSADQTAQLVRV